MNIPHEHPDAGPPFGPEPLPADLAPIARALDRLAAVDGAAMPPELAERIATSTAGRLMAREVSHLEALSTSDRAAASSTLEDRVFMATRALITQAGTRVHEPASRAGKSRPHRYVWYGRLAMAAGLLLAVGVTVPLLRTVTTTTTSTPGVVQVASAIQSDFDELAEVIDAADGRDDVTRLNVALRTVEDAVDDDPLKSVIDDGGAL